MKTTELLGIVLLCGFAAPANPVFAAANGPVRPVNNPDAPQYTLVSGNLGDLLEYNTELKALLANPDPASAKAFQEKYPSAPLITATGVPPPNVEGDFVIGPVHPPAPEITVQPGVPQGNCLLYTSRCV